MKKTKFFCLAAVLLSAMMNSSAANWEKPVPPESTPVSGNSYYLYSAYAEQFFGITDIHATMNAGGSPILFTASANEWTLQSANGYLYADLDFIGCDGIAGDMNTVWYVERQSAGTYRIRPSKADADFSWELYPDMWMGLSFESWTLKPLLKADEGSIDWNIVAEADYDAFLSKMALHRVMTELQEGGFDVTELLSVYNSSI